MKRLRFFSLIMIAGLTACGGSSETVAGIDARGNPVVIVSKGTISGFGSVIVNGVRFDTTDASFDIDGVVGTEADLAVGKVVVVLGSINDAGTNGNASSVSFDDVVEGPISAIDTLASTVTVLEQLVVLDADTSFDDSISPASIEGLAVNDVVEVSGFRLADGSISATRIEAKPAGGEFEITAAVSNLQGTTFQLQALTVDFGAAQLDDFPAGGIANGQIVEARGSTFGNNGEFLATRVEHKGNDLGGNDGDRIEIEGFITRFASVADFDVEGTTVTTDASTLFENGDAGDLALNRKVEVEGNLDANGNIVASRVEIKLANFIRIESMVEATSATTLTVFGIVINVNSATRLEDKSSAELTPFSLGDINVGDYVETRGFENASGVVATRVEREDFDNEVAIRAFVDSVADPDFTIHGVLIQTDSSTVFRQIDGQVLSASEFFAVAAGRLVEAEGTPLNGGILAEEVEFED